MSNERLSLVSYTIVPFHGANHSAYIASQKKQNPETKGCCDQVPGYMTIVIYISWIMINMLSNDI